MPTHYSIGFTTIGDPDPSDFDVVWNGTIHKEHTVAQQKAAPDITSGIPRNTAYARDAASLPRENRWPDFVEYLQTHTTGYHSSRSVSDALLVDPNLASQWLNRAWKRGLVVPDFIVSKKGTHQGGNLLRVWKVKTEEAA